MSLPALKRKMGGDHIKRNRGQKGSASSTINPLGLSDEKTDDIPPENQP